VSVKGDQYREKAKEAETLARLSIDFHASETYRTVAKHYLELAEEADKQDALPRW
jgi:hypothetical protein